MMWPDIPEYDTRCGQWPSMWQRAAYYRDVALRAFCGRHDKTRGMGGDVQDDARYSLRKAKQVRDKALSRPDAHHAPW